MPMNSRLTVEQLAASAESLVRVCERFSSLADLRPLLPKLDSDGILAAAVVGSAPSEDSPRVRELLGGGFAGLRAFLHLWTEVGYLRALELDPFTDVSELERSLAQTGATSTGFQRVLERHGLLHAAPDGQKVCQAAHAEAITAELTFVAMLVGKLGVAPDKGLLFWNDPGLSERQKDANATLLLGLGLLVPPRSAAAIEPFRVAYQTLVERAAG